MAKLVKCKACGEMVAKSAKKCPHCGAKVKKHGFIRFMAFLLSVFAVFVIAVITLSATNDADSSTLPDDQTATLPAKEIVIIDNDICKVTYKDLYMVDDIAALYVILRVENKTENTIWAHPDKAAINGTMVTVATGMPTNITPGHNAETAYCFLPYDGNKEDVEKIDFSMLVFDSDTTENLLTSEQIVIDIK